MLTEFIPVIAMTIFCAYTCIKYWKTDPVVLSLVTTCFVITVGCLIAELVPVDSLKVVAFYTFIVLTLIAAVVYDESKRNGLKYTLCLSCVWIVILTIIETVKGG